MYPSNIIRKVFMYAVLHFMSLPQNVHVNIEIWLSKIVKMETYIKIKRFEDVTWYIRYKKEHLALTALLVPLLLLLVWA
jgi:hypothetical protein